MQLGKHLARVLFPSQAIHDFELGELHIYGVVVLAEEDFDVVL